MQVSIHKYNPTQLGVAPLDGRFKGQTVALVEAVFMTNCHRDGDILIGTLNAGWGATMLKDSLDGRTIRGILGNRAFDYTGLKATSHELFKQSGRAIIMSDRILST